VTDLRTLYNEEIATLEPDLFALGALFSPSTGIIDTHQYMLSLVGKIQELGGMIAYRSAFQSADAIDGGYKLTCNSDEVSCTNLINAGGLHSQDAAERIRSLSGVTIPKRYLTKGSYFTMAKASPFKHLIYPVPNTASLGVHVTLDLAGQIRFGPDQEWVETLDYEVDPARADGFYAAIRKYYPALEDNCLHAAYSGIRPKTQSPGDPMKDFEIQGPPEHGLQGLVSLYGMESPGLTSSLAIGEYVADLLKI
jgi:L-2-hydroxyglutarate oxidase LhgO